MVETSSKTIVLEGCQVAYLLRSGTKFRRLTVAIRRGGKMAVTKPHRLELSRVEDFLRQKSGWIIKKINQLSQGPANGLWTAGREDYLAHKNRARAIAAERIVFFNQYYNFCVGKVSIRNQQSRWGSCSRKGNLNFNYRIALIPGHLADYVVVHELCHLGQLNHSPRFWDLVKISLPDYAVRRQELKRAYR